MPSTEPGPVKATPYDFPFNGDFGPHNTALVIIDMQTDFCLPGGYCDQMGLDVSLTGGVIAPTKKVLQAMRVAGFPVFHTREGHRADLADLNDNKRWRSARLGAEIGSAGPCGRILTRGEPGWEIVPDLAPIEGEPIIDKPGKGAFYATDFEALLLKRGIRNLIFTGVTTDCCVHTTMRDANDRGFECLLLEDCCAATETANHDTVIRITVQGNGLFGTVASSADLLAALAEFAPAIPSREPV